MRTQWENLVAITDSEGMVTVMQAKHRLIWTSSQYSSPCSLLGVATARIWLLPGRSCLKRNSQAWQMSPLRKWTAPLSAMSAASTRWVPQGKHAWRLEAEDWISAPGDCHLE